MDGLVQVAAIAGALLLAVRLPRALPRWIIGAAFRLSTGGSLDTIGRPRGW